MFDDEEEVVEDIEETEEVEEVNEEKEGEGSNAALFPDEEPEETDYSSIYPEELNDERLEYIFDVLFLITRLSFC